MKQWKAESLLLLITLVWGGTFTFTKIGLHYISPSFYIVIRFTTALLISLIFFGRFIGSIDKKTLIHGLVLGLFFGGGFLFQTYGLNYTTVTKSAFITGLTVPITPFFYRLISKKHILLWQKIGVVVATMGLWVFTRPEIDNINLGDVLTLFSCIFWALYITYMDVYTKGETEFSRTAQLVILQFAAALPLSLIALALIEGNFAIHGFGYDLIISLTYNGVLASFVLTFIHTSVQKYTNPVKAALIFALEPVFAGIIALVALNEVLSLVEYTGALIMIIGVIISQAGQIFEEKFLRRIYSR